MTDTGAVIRLGRVWNVKKGRVENQLVTFPLSKGHFELLAPPGAGKGACLEIPNLLLGLRSCSVLSIDPSGQNAAVTAEARRRIGNEVLCLNPFGLHVRRYPDLASCGFNPLTGISTRSRKFLQHCQAIGEALVQQQSHDPHWSDSARGLITGIIMWEVLKASRENRAPLLEEVRRMLCEPEAKDGNGLLTAGLRYHSPRCRCSKGNGGLVSQKIIAGSHTIMGRTSQPSLRQLRRVHRVRCKCSAYNGAAPARSGLRSSRSL
jgi:type IV secretory pathway TraG/TraD family ATPase VirD4